MNKAVYAGSFDPITNGHLWVIMKAAKIFDEVIIAVGVNPAKRYTYSEHDRVELIKQSCHLAGITNVKVEYVGSIFITDFAASHEASFIIKGIRNSTDLEYEKVQLRANDDLNSAITTIFLIPPPELEYVSSSFVKGFMGYEGWENKITRYVPDIVREHMINFWNKSQ